MRNELKNFDRTKLHKFVTNDKFKIFFQCERSDTVFRYRIPNNIKNISDLREVIKDFAAERLDSVESIASMTSVKDDFFFIFEHH